MDTESKTLSLALVLLETTSPYSGPEARNVSHEQARKYREWRQKRDQQNDKVSREKLKQVQAILYKTLYEIIEDYGKTHNNGLNMAIGKALALVIDDSSLGVQRDPKLRDYVQRLVNVLKPMMTEAVNAVDEAPPDPDAVAEKTP